MGGPVREVDGEEGDAESPVSSDDYAQPSDRELLALRTRLSAPEIAGVSYRCPPAPEDES